MSSAPGPDSLGALLDRGEELAAGGDARGAVTFYQSALAAADGQQEADEATFERLRAANAFVQSHMLRFTSALDDRFKAAVTSDPVEQLRLHHARDILSGEREIHAQQPSAFYYPYLAQRQFFERSEFAWVDALEARTPAIRAELVRLLDSDADFQPYVEDEPNRPKRDFHALNNDPKWSALYLWRDGKRVAVNANRCPETMAALDQIPLTHIGRRTPAALFSRLEPGAHIPPHHGMLNCRLICHLPLIVPDGCWLRVGNETRLWEEGKLLIFDDSIVHEAMNPSAELRIILLFDIWRPELGPAEQASISSIFEAIDDFRGVDDL